MGPVPGILPSFLCLALTSIITCADVPLRFLSEPLSAVQVAESQVELRCAAEPPSALLSWLFNGQQLDGQRLAGAEVRPGSLSLLSLQPLHGGRYQCVASTAAGAIISRSAYVSLAGLSDFGETARETVTAEEGGAAHIECRLPKSNPPAVPRYRVQGKWLEHSTDNFLILPSGNLQIVSVSAQDRGTYKCGAMNPVTRETKVEPHGHRLAVRRSEGRTPVRILYPRTPLLLTVVQPDSLTLECVVSGSPAPTVRWTKGGRSLAQSGRRRLLHSNLVLDSARETDAGDYQCIAETEAGELVMANYTVRVLEPAYLLRGLSDQSLPVGSTARFTCASRGNPAPNITWFHNAAPLHPSPRHQLSGARLRIAAVTHQDQGVYQCLADNGIGSAQSAGRLIIQSVHSSKPVITSPPSSSKVAEGDFVALSCNASGRPPPLIRWYDSQGPISSHPAHLLRAQPRRAPQAAARAWSADPPHLTMSRAGSSSLYIQAASLGHSGRYVCEASNELGSVQAEAFLTVVPFESSTVGVAGEAPPSGGGGDLVQSDEGEGGYRQEAGLGEDKATPTERTSADPPPEAPIILSAPQTHKPDMYDLVWRPGRDWGTPINAYFVKYRKLDDGGNMVGGWYTVRVPGSENELRLTELEPSSLYEVLMVARSQAGEGQPAMLTFRTSKERPSTSKKTPLVTKVPPVKRLGVVIPGRHSGVVPEAPDRPTISMATETSVYVTWIPRANGGSPITAFRVEYRRLGRSTEWGVAADSISPSKLSVEVRSLEPGASYKFRVVAVNTYGESPHSGPSRPYSVAGFSGRFSKPPITGPHIAYTEAVSDTQIMLKWTYTSSSNNNTPIQGFYIYYRPTDSDNDSDYKRDLVEGMKQWHLISHLQPETSYDIKMQCFNEGGESEYSNVMICETRVKRAPGASDFPPVPPKDLATPPSPSERGVGGGVLGSSPRSSDMLYLIVGSVLGVMVLILLVFIAMCLWKNRQQNALHKYDPPGYLYQGAEMSAHMLEYTTLPRTGRINGSLHALSNGCPHLHLKVGNGAGLNGGNGLYPGPDGTLEYEHPPHHLPNGGGMYSALPQSDPSECLSCRNCRNNNRCFSKTNGTLPIMHHVGPCRQDNLEMVPLSHVTTPPHCDTSAPELPECHGEMGEEGQKPGEDTPPPLSQHPCCQLGELHQECQEGEQGEDEPCMEMESPVFCWEPLSLPPLDCNEKTAWISAGTAKDSSLEGFIQAQLQET